MEKNASPVQNPWLTIKQAAAYLGIAPSTLYDYTKRRGHARPPFARLGGKNSPYRFPKDKFIEWAHGPK